MSLKESLGNLGGLMGGQQAAASPQNQLAYPTYTWPNSFTTTATNYTPGSVIPLQGQWVSFPQQIPFTWPAPNCSCGQPAVATCLACTNHDSAPTMANPAGIECSHYLCFGCFILHYADGHANIRQDTPEPHPIEEAAEESAVNG